MNSPIGAKRNGAAGSGLAPGAKPPGHVRMQIMVSPGARDKALRSAKATGRTISAVVEQAVLSMK